MVTFFIRVGSRVVSIIINLNKIQMILAARFILRDFYFCFHYISAKGRKITVDTFSLCIFKICNEIFDSRNVILSLYGHNNCFSSIYFCLRKRNLTDSRRFCIHHIRLHRIGGIFSFGCPLCIRAERHTQHHRGCQQHRQRLLVFHFCHASCFFTKPV